MAASPEAVTLASQTGCVLLCVFDSGTPGDYQTHTQHMDGWCMCVCAFVRVDEANLGQKGWGLRLGRVRAAIIIAWTGG